ncbi:hypothetical protein Tco_0984677 [Tanacetum coccineum]
MGVKVSLDVLKRAATLIGCSMLTSPFNYLGVKVRGNMSRINSWDEVIFKVSTRLSKWKLKTLSIGGRLTLLKSVLTSIPLHHKSIFKLSMGVLNKLESIRRNLFNGVNGLDRKIAWIGWKKVLASKKNSVQVTELKSVNESLNLTVEELYKARALAEATLRESDELISDQCEKKRLLEEQFKPFHEFANTIKRNAELIVRFSDDKYYALKEFENLKVVIKSLQTENQDLKSRESELKNLEKVYETKESVLLKDIDQMKSQVSELLEKLNISNQELKQQIIHFEEDKRMFLAKNEFLEKVTSSVQKEYNDLLASNDVLKQRFSF